MTMQIKSTRRFVRFLILVSFLAELVFFIISLAFSLFLPTANTNVFWFLFAIFAIKGPIASIFLAGFQNQKIAPQVIGRLIGISHGVLLAGFFVLPFISNLIIGIGSFIILAYVSLYFGSWVSMKIAQQLERFISFDDN